MNIVAIIQARLGSSRLPKKILKDINNEPLLKYLINRINKSKKINSVIVATSNSTSDDELVNWLNIENIKYFRGSENDVLDRFYKCASFIKADIIVRITADDPFKDPSIIDQALDIFLDNNNIDYVSNTIKTSYPEGIDIEVFSYSALKIANKNALSCYEREHVTPYIIDNNHLFKTKNFLFKDDLSNFRLTVDHPEDLLLARKICKYFKNDPYIDFLQIVDFLRKNPKIAEINKDVPNREYLIKKPGKNKNE